MNKIVLSLSVLVLLLVSCGHKAQKQNHVELVKYEQKSPDFQADSAYAFVEAQVNFGPRVPSTKEHVACGDYLVTKLKDYGAEVIEQKTVLTAFDGNKLNTRNIIASYGVEKEDRILLFAHWDTRPFSDHDANKDNFNKPVLGANDGASGVGVLLEIARNIQLNQPKYGIDIILFDSEDYGPPSSVDKPGDWWCLGSQYWARNPHKEGYKAKYGILLDMVGAPDATFYREEISMHYARSVVEKVWSTARQLGYGKYFVSQNSGGITDDHLYVNQIARIPSIDIIQYDNATETGFGHYWHTQNDDMSNISKETLKAVGQTVLEVVYAEE